MKVKFTPDVDRAEEYKDLTPGNIYRVIELAGDVVRVMSDEGRPYCYPLPLFTTVDATWPSDWVSTGDRDEDGNYYAAPESLSEPDFFERVFDNDKEARMILRLRLQKWGDGED